MFETYAKSNRGILGNKWFLGIIGMSVLIHMVVGGYVVAASLWGIDYVVLTPPPPKAYGVMQAATAPPALSAQKPPEKVVSKEDVQPNESEDEDIGSLSEAQADSDFAGSALSAGCGGPGQPICAATFSDGLQGLQTNIPKPKEEPKAQTVRPDVLKSKFKSGDQPRPSRPTKVAMTRAGTSQVIGTFKVCVNPDGGVSNVSQMKSTGYPEYDTTIIQTMKSWKFDPMVVDGKKTAMCGTTTIIYKLEKTGI